MHFGYTIIYVEDVISTINFYEKALACECSFIHDSKQYAELNTGDTKLAFAHESMAKDNGIDIRTNRKHELPAGIEIAFVTDDVASAFHQATNFGAIEVQQPSQKPWGQTVAYIRDLNGLLIEICSPMTSV